MTRKNYTRDPRHVASKATDYLRKTRLSDVCYIGPEPEFFIFDQVRYEQIEYRSLLRDRLGGRGLEYGPLQGTQPGLQSPATRGDTSQ